MSEQQGFAEVTTVPGVSMGTVYVVVGQNDDFFVAIKPEVSVVMFDSLRRFFQIGFRIHIRPREGKDLMPKATVAEQLNIGHLGSRENSPPQRYVGVIRVPVCGLTLSPWVVQESITEHKLIEMLVNGLYERLNAAGLSIFIPPAALIELSRERFLDMIPDNKTPLPEMRCYFGRESYYPPQSEGPPKPNYSDEVGLGDKEDEQHDKDSNF